jgi:hypothetical protein
MTTSTQYVAAPSNKARWAGRILSGLAIAFLVVDSFMKLAKTAPAVKGTAELGYPPSLLVPLGIILLSCVVLYALPKTSVLGAILLTAYLGGAVATQVRVGNPLFGFILFPVYLGVMIWAGLALRDPALRASLLSRKGFQEFH